MKADILKFFNVQRQIFGICPNSHELFRLSDCQVFLRKQPTIDWLDRLDKEADRLDRLADQLEEKKAAIQGKARVLGRVQAAKVVKKLDPVFTPRKLNPDDAKVLFHPIDYLVFDGMKNTDAVKRIVLLDRETDSQSHRVLQKSIERVVEKEHFEWVTMRVGEDGNVVEEA